MKKISIVITFLFAVLCGAAQVKDTRPLWGIKAAFDVNLPGDWHGDAGSVRMYRHGFGGSVGAIYNVYLGGNFFVEPGVSVFYDKYSYDNLVISGPGGDAYQEDPSLDKVGLRVPLVAGYMINFPCGFSMNVFTGPELDYAFAGAVNVDDKDALDGSDISLFGEYGNQHRASLGWIIGAGFPFGNWAFTLEGALGVTDLLKGGMSFRENRVTLGLSYYF